MNYFTKPSFYGIIITGIIIFYLLVLFYNNLQKITITEISLFGILVGIHCLLHLGLEINYQYNPMEYIIRL